MKFRITSTEWIYEEGVRLDPGPFVSSAYEAKKILDLLNVPKDSLKNLTKGKNGGIYNGPQFSRVYLHSIEHTVPFLTTTSMMQSDISNLARIKKTDAESNKLSYLKLEKHSILISCSGTIGRMTYANANFEGVWSNQDILKVIADEEKVGSGYLYAFFNTKFGLPLILSGTYGAMIKHIEPSHIENMPVPRLGNKTESQIDCLMKASVSQRVIYQNKIQEATDLLFKSAGLKDISAQDWHDMGADIGFSTEISDSSSLRALNFNSRYTNLIAKLKRVPHKTLGNVCSGGKLGRGGSFKRIETESKELGIKLVAQKQGFWSKPEGKWLVKKFLSKDCILPDETVLIAARGTLGEREVYCRSLFVTGRFLENAYSGDFYRVISSDKSISNAYLYAFLRSETAFRCMRSMSSGSKQQGILMEHLKKLPIPIINDGDKKIVEDLIRDAHKAKDLADRNEEEAIGLVESVIEAISPKI